MLTHLIPIICVLVAPAQGEPAGALARTVQPSATRTHAALSGALADLARAHPTRATTRTIGVSAGGTPIEMLVLSSSPEHADARPGILVVAGMEGTRWSGTEVALVLAEELLMAQPEMLDALTVFVVPRANPDAAGAFFAVPRRDITTNATPHDDDRDRQADENPPQDLNGDGMITVMRARGLAAPFANPTLVADSDDPRLMRAPDPLKGEVPEFTMFVEGIDTDADGRIAEDPPGGVAPDRNFPHRWPEFEDGAGAYPLIAPEANALAQFVLAHPTLVGAFVIGRLDTVVNVPDGRARAEGGTPMIISEEDARAYGALAKIYRDTIGQSRAASADSAGSFVAWMNAQRGVPTFAAQLRGAPDAPPPAASAPVTGAAHPPAAAAGGAQNNAAGSAPGVSAATAPDTVASPANDTTPAAAPGAAPAARPARGGRGRGAAAGQPTARPTASDHAIVHPDDAAWLAHSDSLDGAGFVAWAPFNHPQLGDVEIGGWVPGWRENVPLADIHTTGSSCAAFVTALAEHRAKVALAAPRVTVLGPGLYRVETVLANTGKLPSLQEGGRSGSVTPAHMVRISPPVDRVRSGQRTTVVRGLKPGETRRLEWVLTASPEEVIELELLFAGAPVEHIAIRNGEVLK